MWCLRAQTSSDLKGPSPDCWENRGALPSQRCAVWKCALLCWRMRYLFTGCSSWSTCHSFWGIWTQQTALTLSSLGRKSTRMQLPASQKTVPIVFRVKGKVLAIVFFVEAAWHHSMLCHFVSGSKWWRQLSSQETKFSTKSTPSEACLWRKYNDTGTQW